MVRQQHFNGEADSFSLEDAVSVIESQNICEQPTKHQWRRFPFLPNGRWSSLTDSWLLARQRSVLGHQVSIVPLAGHNFLHLGGLLPFPLSLLQKHPETDVGALCGKLPPARGEEGAGHVRFRPALLESAIVPPELPEDTARGEDLIVQLLRGAPFDHGALLVVHIDVVPHVVRGGNRANVVNLQPHQAETQSAWCVEKNDAI